MYSALIKSMHLLVNEGFSPIVADEEDVEAQFTISVRDLIAICERVAPCPSWDL